MFVRISALSSMHHTSYSSYPLDLLFSSIGEEEINEAPLYQFYPEDQIFSTAFYFRNPRPYVFPLIL